MTTTQTVLAPASSTTKTPSSSFAEEAQLARQILLVANGQSAGALSSDAAIDIFKRSGLSYAALRDIWAIADRKGSGDLSFDELTVAIRLMGWVQAGEALNESLVEKAGPLPTLEGITDSTEKKTPPMTPQPQQVQFPPVNPEDIMQYKRAFLNAGPVDGLLDDNKVMDSFMTSSLPYSDIWKINKLLHRSSNRSALDFREFALGMYLIRALQECLIPSVPDTFPQELFEQIPDLKQEDKVDRVPLPIPSQTYLLPSVSSSFWGPELSLRPPEASSSRMSFVGSDPSRRPWSISAEDKAEAERRFEEIDVERNGFIAGDAAARFFLTFGLPGEDLTRIWALADLNHDNRMTLDGFAIALHLITRRLEGEELPDSLPVTLLPSVPDIHKPPTIVIPKSPNPAAKSKPPPPPPPPKRNRSTSTKGLNGIVSPSSVTSSPSLPSSSIKYPQTSHSPPVPPKSPIPPRVHSRSLSSSPSLSSLNTPTSIHRPAKELLSPFEDPTHPSATSSATGSLSESLQNSPAFSPRPPDSNVEALEEFKKETARLSLQVEGLLSQLTAQNKLRDSNEALRNENDKLKSQLRDMERTVSEVLSASDQQTAQEEYTQTIDRLTAELSNKITQSEDLERMLAVVTQDAQELRVSLRESQQALAKEKAEVEEHKQVISSQGSVISELKSRLSDMSKAMSMPTPGSSSSSSSSSANPRELRILIRDVTKENDALKSQVRDMQKSMEQMLLSTRSHARFDEVERENKRLKQHVGELEMIAAQLQSSASASSSSNSNMNGSANAPSGSSAAALDSLKKENVQLKSQLSNSQREVGELRSSLNNALAEMRQKIDNLTHENNRLKMEAQAATARHGPREDNSVPPPAYDDSFVIPP
ncbi:hypothetical protein CPC08DRAFT_703357 [Agrocybe pediades]|nr:hypothetical protein CPC08DRAFT_703357 [Agrocybe pediades]